MKLSVTRKSRVHVSICDTDFSHILKERKIEPLPATEPSESQQEAVYFRYTMKAPDDLNHKENTRATSRFAHGILQFPFLTSTSLQFLALILLLVKCMI